MVKEVSSNRTGRVLHVHRALFAFLHNREILENSGVFVAGARALTSVAPKSVANKPSGGVDPTKMNPDIATPAYAAPATGGMVGSGGMGRGRRDPNVGLHVTVIKGPHKGYRGIIKDVNGTLCRVELHTSSKVITVDKGKLGVKESVCHFSGFWNEWGQTDGFAI
jgi:transcription elongation factor SPT5